MEEDGLLVVIGRRTMKKLRCWPTQHVAAGEELRRAAVQRLHVRVSRGDAEILDASLGPLE